MKILLTLFVLLFSSSVIAEDITDFQIEGISVGDSLLSFFSKNKIEETTSIYYPKSNSYYQKQFKINSNLYDELEILLKNNDNNFIIKGIGAKKYFKDNIEDCYSLKKNISSDIFSLFKDVEIIDGKKRKHYADTTGKSFTTDYQINFNDKSYISISCYDWSNKLNLTDSLKVYVHSKEIFNFLTNEAYY